MFSKKQQQQQQQKQQQQRQHQQQSPLLSDYEPRRYRQNLMYESESESHRYHQDLSYEPEYEPRQDLSCEPESDPYPPQYNYQEFLNALNIIDDAIDMNPNLREEIAKRYGFYTQAMIDDSMTYLKNKISSRAISRVTTSRATSRAASRASSRMEFESDRQPMSKYEKKLVDGDFVLPSKYFNSAGHFCFSQRPEANVPAYIINNKTHTKFDQNQLATMIASSATEKWLNEYIISELKPLFLRIRNLDVSKKNEILRGFFTRLFPSLARNDRSKLDDLAKTFRNGVWSDWRHNLWTEIRNEYKKIETAELSEMSARLKDNQIRNIFRLWLRSTSSELPPGAIEQLKQVALIGFRCLYYHNQDNSVARQKFFKIHSDLYTVDMAFQSSSGNNIAASLDLSRYDFAPDSFDSDKESPN